MLFINVSLTEYVKKKNMLESKMYVSQICSVNLSVLIKHLVFFLIMLFLFLCLFACLFVCFVLGGQKWTAEMSSLSKKKESSAFQSCYLLFFFCFCLLQTRNRNRSTAQPIPASAAPLPIAGVSQGGHWARVSAVHQRRSLRRGPYPVAICVCETEVGQGIRRGSRPPCLILEQLALQ